MKSGLSNSLWSYSEQCSNAEVDFISLPRRQRSCLSYVSRRSDEKTKLTAKQIRRQLPRPPLTMNHWIITSVTTQSPSVSDTTRKCGQVGTDVMNVCNVYQKFLINAFVIFSSTFIILINVTWNVEKLCRIARVKWSIWREAKHFTYLLRHGISLRHI